MFIFDKVFFKEQSDQTLQNYTILNNFRSPSHQYFHHYLHNYHCVPFSNLIGSYQILISSLNILYILKPLHLPIHPLIFHLSYYLNSPAENFYRLSRFLYSIYYQHDYHLSHFTSQLLKSFFFENYSQIIEMVYSNYLYSSVYHLSNS